MDTDKKTFFKLIEAGGTGDSVALCHIVEQEAMDKDVIVLVANDFKDKEALTKMLKELPKETIVIIENIDEIVKKQTPKFSDQEIYRLEARPYQHIPKFIDVEEKSFSKFRGDNNFKGGKNRKLRRY